MKRKNFLVLDKKNDKAVQIFSELGMPKNLAKTLLYIYQVDECRSGDIMHGTRLRQPEISVAVQELRKRRWITKRDIKKKGKGRPFHIYSSTKPLSEILKSLEQEKLKEVESIKNNISEIKNLILNR